MKKLSVIAAALLLFASVPLSLSASTEATAISLPSDKPKPVESPENTALINRLDEIKAMDKSEMTSAEKKELRNEAKETKKNLRLGGGVYLSAGALVLIIVLLIVLL
ncbi:MAG: hypothetical protein R3D00_00295 [Bacteroidia bacterium]